MHQIIKKASTKLEKLIKGLLLEKTAVVQKLSSHNVN